MISEKKILLVEDSTPDAEFLRAQLKSTRTVSFSLSHVRRLAEALHLLGKEQFDLILLDLGLPDSQGMDTASAVRRHVPAVPIIVLTGLADEELAIKALQQDIQDYLVKGRIRKDHLLRAIHYAMERKRAMEALRESEERLRNALEASHTGSWDLDPINRTAHGSPELERIFGYERPLPHWTYKIFLTHVLPEDRAIVDEKFRQAKATMGEWNFECRIRRADGQVRWIWAAGRHRVGPSGNPLGITGLVQDITDRRRTEEEIKVSKYLSDAINSINAVIHSSLDLDTIMQKVIVEAAEAIGADGSSIGLFQGDFFVIKHVYNMPEELRERSCSPEEVKAPFHVRENKRALVVDDAAGDSRVNSAFLSDLGVRSLLVTPLKNREKVIGTLNLYSTTRTFAFVEAHLDFAEKLSATLFLAFENARLFGALRESEERFRSFFNLAAVGTIQVDPATGRLIDFNGEYSRITGYSHNELTAMRFRDITHPHDMANWVRFSSMVRGETPMYDAEERFIRKDGKVVWVHVSAALIRNGQGRPIRIAGIVQDITARKRMENEIKHMALHDTLTGLPNKRFFLDIVNIEMAEVRRSQKKMAILFLDLDGFKKVNDTLGHDIGDQLLVEVAGRFKSAIRASDVVARIGGDEFNILLTDIVHAEDSAEIARKILECTCQPFRLAGHDVHVSASIGIIIFPDDGEEIDVLFRYADIAMYHAKELGKNNYQFYNPTISKISLERIRMESWLRQTLKKKELVVLYQPQIDITTHKMVSAEALIRWHHPELGLLEASSFVPLAEETGFITTIDEWVLETVCRQTALWQKAGHPPLRITVNLSARHFHSPKFIATIDKILQGNGMTPDHLDLEITESMAMHDVQRTAECLQQLVNRGVHITIDDFGTGYSSLNYLKRLPIDRLKIDKSFIKDIATDPDDRAIIIAITDMAHTMRMRVVAEGVETEDQLAFLEENECDEVQGYLFSKPLPAERISELLLS